MGNWTLKQVMELRRAELNKPDYDEEYLDHLDKKIKRLKSEKVEEMGKIQCDICWKETEKENIIVTAEGWKLFLCPKCAEEYKKGEK